MPDIKKIKAEILTAAGGSAPPEAFVRQTDIMDMMLTEYFNASSRAPKSMTLNALVAAAGMCKDGAKELTADQLKAILDKYEPKP